MDTGAESKSLGQVATGLAALPLEERDRTMRALMDAVSESVAVLDLDFRIIDLNDSSVRRLGRTREEVQGRVVFDFLPPEVVPNRRQKMLEVIASRRVAEFEDTRGGIRFFNRVVPVMDSEGRVERLVVFGLDVTSRERERILLREKADTLENANRELQRFAYLASHDLQEPIRVLGTCVDLLSQKYRGHLDQQADELIRFAVDGAARAQTMIRDLLTYARLGRHETPPEPVDLNSVLAEVLETFGQRISETGAKVTVNELPQVMGYRIDFVRLYQNLIDNAIKFRSNRNLEIEAGAEWKGRELELWVRDNGLGIPTVSIPKVFGVFERFHGRGKYPGSGIGLAACKRIVESCGGRIWVESMEGTGTVFKFVVPAVLV